MDDTEVIVKGELHSSRGDLAHEREILVEGVDHLILEGAEQEAEYGLFQHWYAFAMLVTEYLFFRIIETDVSILKDIAKAQDADITRTRESNASILENSHVFVRVVAAIVFFVLLFASAAAGLLEKHTFGASLLIGSAMIPILILRVHETVRSSDSRDEKMAELITEAAEEGGRIIAIVGDGHTDRVSDYLPDWIDPVREDPKYPFYSWQHITDIAYPAFVFVSVLWMFYSVFIAYIEFAWTFS